MEHGRTQNMKIVSAFKIKEVILSNVLHMFEFKGTILNRQCEKEYFIIQPKMQCRL